MVELEFEPRPKSKASVLSIILYCFPLSWLTIQWPVKYVCSTIQQSSYPTPKSSTLMGSIHDQDIEIWKDGMSPKLMTSRCRPSDLKMLIGEAFWTIIFPMASVFLSKDLFHGLYFSHLKYLHRASPGGEIVMKLLKNSYNQANQ